MLLIVCIVFQYAALSGRPFYTGRVITGAGGSRAGINAGGNLDYMQVELHGYYTDSTSYVHAQDNTCDISEEPPFKKFQGEIVCRHCFTAPLT